MNGEERIMRLFEDVRFGDEPPMASGAGDDLLRGRRHLRHRRVATVTAGVAGVAVVATGVALALPGGGSSPAPSDGVGRRRRWPGRR